MRNIAMLLLFAIAISLGGAAPATRPILTNDAVENRGVKLVSARISDRRGQNLEARFALAKDPKNDVVAVVSFPAHSHTVHETTIMNIIRASVDWSVPEGRHEWRKARMVPVFWIPPQPRRTSDFEHWWFDKFEGPGAGE